MPKLLTSPCPAIPTVKVVKIKGAIIILTILKNTSPKGCILTAISGVSQPNNIPAIKLYEKYGFKSLGTRKGYYQDNNEDALIMWTENIFSDTYKSMFAQNVSELEKLVKIE